MILHEVKVKYTKQTGEDNPGTVKESYLVETETCSDAEAQVINEIKPIIFGSDFEAPSIRKRIFFGVFRNVNGEFWYEAKVEVITIDGDKEVRKAVAVLVQDNSLSEAAEFVKTEMNSYDCELIAIKKTQVVDILRLSPNRPWPLG